jgi:hypothetical protein
MKYATDMGTGAMIYIPSFINYWFSLSKVDGGDTDSMGIA